MRVLLITGILLALVACDDGGRDGDDDDGAGGDDDTGAECNDALYECDAEWWACMDDDEATVYCNMLACDCAPSSCWDTPGPNTATDTWSETFGCDG